MPAPTGAFLWVGEPDIGTGLSAGLHRAVPKMGRVGGAPSRKWLRGGPEASFGEIVVGAILARMWRRKSRQDDLRWLEGIEEEDRAHAALHEEAEAARLAAERTLAQAGQVLRYIHGVVYVGGFGSPLVERGKYKLDFYGDIVGVVAKKTPVFALPYRTLTAIEVSGPGAYTEGGGFVGGGFGVQGALEGMAIAGLLNALTTRTRSSTVLRFVGQSIELFFVLDDATPDEVTIYLSPIRARLDPAAPTHQPSTSSSERDDPVGELERLAALHRSGALSTQEFETLKAAVVRRMSG